MWREPRQGALFSFPRVCPARQSAIIRHKVILSLICLILRGSVVAVGGQGKDAKHRLVIFARGPENQPKSLTRAIGTLRISNYCGTTVKSHGGVCEQIGSDFMVVSSAGEESQLQAEEALIELNKNLADNGMSEFEFFLEPAFMTELQSEVTLQQQADAPYNLARLTSPDRDPLKTVYEYVTTGDAVNVYIVDTNIRSDDPEFAHRPGRGRSGSRVRSGYTAFDVEQQCYGHGTHVAGVVGGLSYGVAKDVTLWEVGVQPCGDVGNTGYFLAGLDWIIANAQYPAIVTTSLLALGRPTHLGDKVTQVLEAGIPFVAAAGNQRSDACGYYPPAVPGVLAIANSDYTDRKNLRSNWGPCVALFAPGTGIPSADSDNPGGVRLLTGTSQAAPHVAGAIAQFLQRVPAATVSQVQDRILETAALDVIDKPGPGTPNRLLQVDLSSWDERVPNELPGFSGTPLLAITPGDRITVDAFAGDQPGSVALRRSIQVSLFNSSQPQSYQVAVQAVSGAVESPAVTPQDWLQLNSSQGTLHWEHPTFISLGFSTTDLAPGTYQAQVTVSMTSTTPSSRTLLVVLRVFCQRLAEPAARKSGKMKSSTIAAERPESWGPGVPGREKGILYLQTQVQFSHPIVDEDSITGVPVLTGCIETVGAGSMLEELTPEESSPLCSTFRLRVSRPAGDVWYGGNKVCVSIRERCLRDIYGSYFPDQTLCETYDAAPQVKLFPAFMAFASDEGLTTAAHEVLLVAAFTEPVSGVEVGSFSVNVDGVGEAQISKVTPVASSSTAYHVLLSLPKQYYGSVSVSLSPSNIKDGAGNALVSTSELSFKRVQVAVMEHGAYELATHMEL